LIFDNGAEFNNKRVHQQLMELGIAFNHLPTAAGAYANPCDNSFNSALKRKYYAAQHATHEAAVIDIISSYYAATEASIRNYFSHCLLVGKRVTKGAVHRLLSQGYAVGRSHKDLHNKCAQYYRSWEENISSHLGCWESSGAHRRWCKGKTHESPICWFCT